MKIALSFLLLVLAACSSPFYVEEQGRSDVGDVAAQLPADAPVSDSPVPSSTDGGSGADAAKVDSGDLEACRARACSNAGAECGSVAATCGGQPVDCGTCSVAYDRCGDSTENKCGHSCLSSFTSVCMAAGKPSEWGVRYGCKQPYRIEGSTKVLRPNGIEGCIYYQVPNGGPGDFYSCCS